MKERLKRVLIIIRNRWGISNSIKKSSNSSVSILGNLLNTSVEVNGNSKIIIGEGCRIRNASIIVKGNNNYVVLEEGVCFSGRIELFGDNNLITIGKDTRINGANFIVHNGTKVEVGSGCLFSSEIDVRTTDSHTIFNADGERINLDKNIIIGEHVWIGRMVSILKGSVIGDGSVIGSMSLVSCAIPKRVIAAGVPAKTIKENVLWEE
jgi:acetyltransferase-like isoleucine patch superfamily enzyme